MSTTTKPTHSVNVTGFSPTTSETHLHDFFSFCGTIKAIDFHAAEPRSAVIHFLKPSAAKTALMLNGGTLDGAHLAVTTESDIPHQEDDRDDGSPLDQTDKPRAGIMAEYLAKGYVLQDHILQRAIEFDSQRGISKRFMNYFTTLDSNLGARALGPNQTITGHVQSQISSATQQAKTIDQQKGFSKMATDYYRKALASPLGQKVMEFYTSTSKQVKDIHEEARRMASVHKNSQSTTQAAPASEPAATAETAPAAASEKAPESDAKA